jgi:hypothetical protein
MKPRTRNLILAACIACTASLASAQQKQATTPVVQLAILLDTSGSMSGLINQARTQLWSIVNDLATTEKNGQRPHLEVALYQYGNSGIASAEGHTQMILPLTDDLDRVSAELFKLGTNGGEEYCGYAIQAATKGLQWRPGDADLKLIFIAGNEPFTQGPVEPKGACKAAISSGIMVNTIHCGDSLAGVSGGWQDGAALADGRFLNIDQNSQVVQVEAPQDKQIAELNTKLNDTYVGYGASGKNRALMQQSNDANSNSISAANLSARAASKASSFYRNSSWDLVDAVKDDGKALAKIAKKDLPSELQGLNQAELEAHIAKKQAERTALQKDIGALCKARDSYVTEARKKLATDGGDTLGQAMISAIRAQAKSRNFNYVAK